MYIRRFFTFVIVFSLIFSPVQAASSWSVVSALSKGASTLVNAAKTGFSSAVTVAPSASSLAKGFAKGLNRTAFLFAIAQLFDGIDWVMDDANNTVRYKDPSGAVFILGAVGSDLYTTGNTPDQTCRDYFAKYAQKYTSGAYSYVDPKWAGNPEGAWYCYFEKQRYGSYNGEMKADGDIDNPWKVVPVEKVANQVIVNASKGDSDAQAAVRSDAVTRVVNGAYDSQLIAGAVPTSESDSTTPPPAIPGDQTGNEVDDLIDKAGAAGQAAADAREAAQAAADAAADAEDAIKGAADAAREAAEAAADVINSAADNAEKAIAQAAADAAAAISDAVSQAAADAKAAADAAADRSIAAAEEAARAARQAARAAEQAAAEAAADAAADAAAKAAAAAKAEAARAAARAAEEAAAKAREEAAKAEAAKPFELPAFCTWAKPVCDFVTWFKEPAPPELLPQDVPYGDLSDVGLDQVDRYEQRIDFVGQCPTGDFSVTMLGRTYSKPIPYHEYCRFLESFAPWLLAMTLLGTAWFVLENT